jgi:hypothetical protein
MPKNTVAKSTTPKSTVPKNRAPKNRKSPLGSRWPWRLWDQAGSALREISYIAVICVALVSIMMLAHRFSVG